ncbi:tetratricopeptide repeat protein [Burkholderiaceae bacterium DAT-1]|nr:tetratricopeptide repeat protein [Burkholderiaceae bacterium DAT-1]
MDSLETANKPAPEPVGEIAQGIDWMQTGRLVEAEQCFRDVYRDTGHPLAAGNLALVLQKLGRLDESVYWHRLTVQLLPDNGDALSNLAGVLVKLGHTSEAMACYQHARELQPDCAAIHSNLGVLYADLLQLAAAEACFLRALSLQPDYPSARNNLGQLYLSQGRYAEGWRLHEARWAGNAPHPALSMMTGRVTSWQGDDVTGKAILIWCEQGFGDAIHFCRYLPMLKARGARRITVVCRYPLMPLLATLDGVDQLIGPEITESQIIEHDLWCWMMSLPCLFGTMPDTIPASIPYLHVPPHKQTMWQAKLTMPSRKIGLVWHGNPGHENNADRSMPSFTTLSMLYESPLNHVHWIAMQPGERSVLRDTAMVTDIGADIQDFGDLAAAIANLDLLISVDTAAVHVAGALGIPCWVLLPAWKTDWRWPRQGDTTPWYPRHMLIWRQTHRGEWRDVLSSILSRLS